MHMSARKQPRRAANKHRTPGLRHTTNETQSSRNEATRLPDLESWESFQSSAALSKLIFNSINPKHLPSRREQIKLETLVHLGRKSIKWWCHRAANVIILALKHGGEEKVMLQKKTNVIFVSTHSFFLYLQLGFKISRGNKTLELCNGHLFYSRAALSEHIGAKRGSQTSLVSFTDFFPPSFQSTFRLHLSSIYRASIVWFSCKKTNNQYVIKSGPNPNFCYIFYFGSSWGDWGGRASPPLDVPQTSLDPTWCVIFPDINFTVDINTRSALFLWAGRAAVIALFLCDVYLRRVKKQQFRSTLRTPRTPRTPLFAFVVA